ncbi:MAG: membrane-bound lytic murein transglycosylase MltF [bacterium]
MAQRVSWQILAILVAVLLFSGCSQTPQLERILASGKLVVGSYIAPTTLYRKDGNLTGPEYELVSTFAKDLGTELDIRIYPTESDLLDAVTRGEVHLAAANLAITPEIDRKVSFTKPYDTIQFEILYRRGRLKPREADEVKNQQLVVPNSATAAIATRLFFEETEVDIDWIEKLDSTAAAQLSLLNDGKIRFVTLDSRYAALAQRYYGNIRTAIRMNQTFPVAWATPRGLDKTLLKRANQFLNSPVIQERIAEIQQRYYDYESRLNYVDIRNFWKNLHLRFDVIEPYFMEAAQTQNLDWHLLAAVGYQESHWDETAVSPTGVAGLMMLTQGTARAMGVTDRRDPQQSILGGAKYLRKMCDKIPQRIQGLDRLWLTLAAYNVGFGHLEDARILTQRQGGDPDDWLEVRERLPLLADEQYYSSLKNGFARGGEPVTFVENIRQFYDMLVWHENPELTHQ